MQELRLKARLERSEVPVFMHRHDGRLAFVQLAEGSEAVDKMRTDELKEGHKIEINYPNQGKVFMRVKSVTQVATGPECGIYRICFYDGGLDLMANADREFQVESAQPHERSSLLRLG